MILYGVPQSNEDELLNTTPRSTETSRGLRLTETKPSEKKSRLPKHRVKRNSSSVGGYELKRTIGVASSIGKKNVDIGDNKKRKPKMLRKR